MMDPITPSHPSRRHAGAAGRRGGTVAGGHAVNRSRPPRRAIPTPVCVLVLAVLAAAALPAGAAQQTLTLDPQASNVGFQLKATGHDVHGTLYLQQGTVRFDPATGAASGRIAIDATRAETGNDSRDKTMHDKVLEVGAYPLFVFVPERFEGSLPAAGSGEVSLVGTLTIHGADHPLTLPATVERDGDRVTATTRFEVPYVEWGMHNPSILFLRVADAVAVTVKAEGELAPGADRAAAAAAPETAGHGRR